jgi:hypothetical protein
MSSLSGGLISWALSVVLGPYFMSSLSGSGAHFLVSFLIASLKIMRYGVLNTSVNRLFQVSAYWKTGKVCDTLMRRRFPVSNPGLPTEAPSCNKERGFNPLIGRTRTKMQPFPIAAVREYRKFPGRNPGPFNHERFATGEYRYRSSCWRHPTTDIDIYYSDISKNMGTENSPFNIGTVSISTLKSIPISDNNNFLMQTSWNQSHAPWFWRRAITTQLQC